MSNANHENETKLLTWLDKVLAKEMDEMIRERGYKGRSEYIRTKVIADVQEHKKSKGR